MFHTHGKQYGNTGDKLRFANGCIHGLYTYRFRLTMSFTWSIIMFNCNVVNVDNHNRSPFIKSQCIQLRRVNNCNMTNRNVINHNVGNNNVQHEQPQSGQLQRMGNNNVIKCNAIIMWPIATWPLLTWSIGNCNASRILLQRLVLHLLKIPTSHRTLYYRVKSRIKWSVWIT